MSLELLIISALILPVVPFFLAFLPLYRDVLYMDYLRINQLEDDKLYRPLQMELVRTGKEWKELLSKIQIGEQLRYLFIEVK